MYMTGARYSLVFKKSELVLHRWRIGMMAFVLALRYFVRSRDYSGVQIYASSHTYTSNMLMILHTFVPSSRLSNIFHPISHQTPS